MKEFDMLTEKEIMEIDGGSVLGTIATGAKVVGAIVGVGTGGVIVGAGVVLVTYYGLKWLLG